MRSRKNNNIVYNICIAIIVCFFGCSIEQSHKSLTFFFDGVDQVNVFNDYLSKDSLSKDAIAKREQLLLKNRPDLVVHLPYKEKKCEKCHTPDKHLRLPLPGLCYQCHKNFNETNRYVHGPVASGNCLKCHNQHTAKYAKLLIRQGQQVCLYCHNSSLIFRSKFHKDIEDAECTLCHNPHGGNNRYMVKESVARNFNGLGLANEIASRHLSAQIYNKAPGDIGKGTEINILNEYGEIVTTTQTDDSGKFALTNLHPDQNYTFKFKSETPDSKINILNYKNDVLYVIEKNRKGKYIFDKAAYETTHNELPKSYPHTVSPKGSSLIDSGQYVINKSTGEIIENTSKINTPGNISNNEITSDKNPSDTINKGTNVVNTKPHTLSTEEIMRDNIAADTANNKEKTVNKNEQNNDNTKGKIIVKKLPDSDNSKEISGTKKSNSSNNGSKNNYETDGVTLVKLAEQISPFYNGTIVCVLNDSADLLGIGKVDAKGNFLLNDFLPYYNVSLGKKDKESVSEIVFLNDKMELIEIIDKTNKDGHFIYSQNTTEQNTKVIEMKDDYEENTELYTSIYFDFRESVINSVSKTELNKVAENLTKNSGSKVYLVGYTDSKGTTGDNIRLAENRVRAAISYLISQGVNRNRIIGKGYEKQKHGKHTDDTKSLEESHQKNRRVDIYIKN